MPYKDPAVRKAYHAKKSKEHYDSNKDQVLATTKATNKRGRDAWVAFKSTLKCTKCGFSHIAALDFHHVNPAEKEYLVSALIRNRSFTKAMKEVEKCIVLCANCHRIHHYEELKNPAL